MESDLKPVLSPLHSMPTFASPHSHKHRSYPKDYGRVQFANDTNPIGGTPSAIFHHPLPTEDPSRSHSSHITRSPSGNIYHTRIHTLLATHERPRIEYDLTLPPRTHAIVHVTSHHLSEPATHPPQQAITIISPLLPWPITIGGHHRSKSSFVSVQDVLDGLYVELRRCVSEGEYSSYLPPQTQARASDAYRRRYRRIRDDAEYQREKTKGLRRVDFLLEYRRWLGLISTTNGPSVWELKVARA